MGRKDWYARRNTSGFRKGRRTEDNLFMLERMIEMSKYRDECMFVAFIDMEKECERVNRKKLFEIMSGYGIHEKLVRLVERVYEENMVKFEYGGVRTGCCESKSGPYDVCF